MKLKKGRARSRELAFVVIGIVCVVLVCCSVVMLSEYSAELEDQASVKAMLYTTEVASSLQQAIGEYQSITEIAAQKLSATGASSAMAFSSAVRTLTNDERFSSVLFARYFKDGAEYSENGMEYDLSRENPLVINAVRRGAAAFAGYFVDKQYNSNVVAFCAPMMDCDYADALVLFYSMEAISGFSAEINAASLSSSRLTALCSAEGEIVRLFQRSDLGEIAQHNNIYDSLRPLINDKSTIDSMQHAIAESRTETFPVQIGGSAHVVSVSGVGKSGASLSIIGVYRCTDIYSAGYSTVNTILGTLVIFFILMILLAIYFVVSGRRTNRRILTMNDTNRRLNCDTRVKFERDAADVLARNRATNFAVVVIEMKHFNYISDNYPEDTVTQVLLHLKMLYSMMLELDELYAYAGDSRFLLLLHYRDIEMLSKRIRNVTNLARSYSRNLPSSYHIELFGGIYPTSMKMTDSVSKMIDLATEAKNDFNVQADFAAFRIYGERMKENHIRNEFIEVHMNSALENKQFIVFYQPKYNIATDKPDGCEALVRWYDPERDEYMKPALFMPLFEANGFIEKLDHYVYEQVCIYMEEAVAQGQPLYPVSVNVSRFTALQPNFIDYYVSVKKKHNIADGFLTLELTESFAYEGYDVLRQTIDRLHKNGFKCSIDDFGTGFSSYNVLKELPMDEIKLDRFFLERGLSDERDLKILSSVIDIARSLGMKVTQEGVETVDQFELLVKLGCHVIQGYYYAKPLYITDYISFITAAQHNSFRSPTISKG